MGILAAQKFLSTILIAVKRTLVSVLRLKNVDSKRMAGNQRQAWISAVRACGKAEDSSG
jgi:hypothetical protein